MPSSPVIHSCVYMFRPRWGTNSTPRPQLNLRGPTSMWREGKGKEVEGKGRKWERGEEKASDGKGREGEGTGKRWMAPFSNS